MLPLATRAAPHSLQTLELSFNLIANSRGAAAAAAEGDLSRAERVSVLGYIATLFDDLAQGDEACRAIARYPDLESAVSQVCVSQAPAFRK